MPARINVLNRGRVVNLANGNKKLEVHIQVAFDNIECHCDNVSVRVYTHSVSAGSSITRGGNTAHGDVDDPQGVNWNWTPGRDGWLTDSKDTDPDWGLIDCQDGPNGKTVTYADKPGMIIPPGEQGAGSTYAYEFFWKADVRCDGQVLDQEFYKLSITGNGGANNNITVGPLVPAQGAAALAEVNRRMQQAGRARYPVDAEGQPWP